MNEKMDTSEHYLDKNEETVLLRIARDTLEAYLGEHRRVDLQAYPLTDALREKHGSFVTLRSQGELRGCIGDTANRYALAESVRENAISAATRDPRFPAVTREELPRIHIEISAMTPGDEPDTPFKKVHDLSELKVGRDGLYIRARNTRGGLLLPQVPIEQGWTLDQFLSAVCRKAGYPDRSWEEPDVELFRFSAQVFGEPPE